MANDKQYVQYMDIPKGGGGTERIWLKDADARASIETYKNTAGTTNKTGSKMFIVGALEQSANPQTYSNSNCYIGTDNCLYSNGTKVVAQAIASTSVCVDIISELT